MVSKHYAKMQADNEQMRAEVERLKEEVNQLRNGSRKLYDRAKAAEAEVERLRTENGRVMNVAKKLSAEKRDAKDEVERLQQENEVLIKQFDAAVQSYQASVEQLRDRIAVLEQHRASWKAEVERLRAMLEEISYCPEDIAIARQALEGEKS